MNKKYLLFAAIAAAAFFALNKKPDRLEIKKLDVVDEQNTTTGQAIPFKIKTYIDNQLSEFAGYTELEYLVVYPKPDITTWSSVPRSIENLQNNTRLEAYTFVEDQSIYVIFDLYKNNVLADRKKYLVHK